MAKHTDSTNERLDELSIMDGDPSVQLIITYLHEHYGEGLPRSTIITLKTLLHCMSLEEEDPTGTSN